MIPFVLLAPFAFIFVWCVARIVARRRRLTWPVVFGRVIDYQCLPETTRGTTMQYVVRYSYEVGTSTFEGKESVPQRYPVKGRVVMRPAIDLNEGDEVAVFVSPDNAKKATIAPRSWETGTGPLLFISGMATVALLILLIRAL